MFRTFLECHRCTSSSSQFVYTHNRTAHMVKHGCHWVEVTTSVCFSELPPAGPAGSAVGSASVRSMQRQTKLCRAEQLPLRSLSWLSHSQTKPYDTHLSTRVCSGSNSWAIHWKLWINTDPSQEQENPDVLFAFLICSISSVSSCLHVTSSAVNCDCIGQVPLMHPVLFLFYSFSTYWFSSVGFFWPQFLISTYFYFMIFPVPFLFCLWNCLLSLSF